MLQAARLSRALRGMATSRTEPEAFFLDVYFNAHPITNPQAKEKPKPSNALVPTSIAYSGGQRDYTVNMGEEVRKELRPRSVRQRRLGLARFTRQNTPSHSGMGVERRAAMSYLAGNP